MKTLVFAKVTLLFFFWMISIHPCQGQSTSFDEYKYLLVLDDDITQPEVEELLLEYNSTEIWVSPFSGVRYWSFNSFPFPDPQSGDPINDINEGLEAAEDEPRVKHLGHSYEFSKGGDYGPMTDSILCVQTSDLQEASTETIKVSILDTGLTPTTNNSGNTYEYGNYTGYNYVGNNNDVEDDHGHGTHVAGVISHVSQHLAMEHGIALNVEFDIRKVFDSTGSASLSDIIYAFDEAVLEGAKIINCSFAYTSEVADDLTPFEHAIITAQQEQVLVIASASNESHNNDSDIAAFPASFEADNIIAVGSHNCEHMLSSFSNYGPISVDLTTGGEFIEGPSHIEGDDLVYKTGTSQSAAYTTGVAVMLASYMDQPNYQIIKCAILESATPSVYLSDLVLTSGFLDPGGALVMLGDCPGNAVPTATRSSEHSDVLITPNPFDHIVEINMADWPEEGVQLSVFDVLGEQVGKYALTKAQGSQIIFNEDLVAGAYVFRLDFGDKVEVRRIIKQ